MAHPGVAKVQHYVPQFLLKHFGTGKKHQLHVFDKQTGHTFLSNARNVAAESRFYDFKTGGDAYSLEPGLSVLEGATKPILKRLLEADTLASVTPEDKAALAVFIAVQMLRTKAMREQWGSLPALLGDALRDRAESDAERAAVDEYIRVPDDNQAAMGTALLILKTSEELALLLLEKDWVYLKTSKKWPFVLGDNPVVLQNTTDRGPRGHLGLAVPGVEVYVPLTPVRAIGLWCTSLSDALLENAERAQQLEKKTPGLYELHRDTFSMVAAGANAILTGDPLPFRKEHVENLNSLQVRFAERYVFSSIPDFSLALDMVASHPATRHGPRIQVG